MIIFSGVAESKPQHLTALDVAAGLVFRGGRLLIAQRRAGGHLGGLWEFPGGKRECRESFRSCLKRELVEELGIQVRVQDLVESITHAYPDRTVRLKFYRCQWLKGEPAPIGCAALAWVTAKEFSRYSFPAADAKLIHRLLAEPELWKPVVD